jgi:hypothetical protein
MYKTTPAHDLLPRLSAEFQAFINKTVYSPSLHTEMTGFSQSTSKVLFPTRKAFLRQKQKRCFYQGKATHTLRKSIF